VDGLETIYFDNGNPDRSWTYKDGKRNGTMTRYRRDGTVEYTCEYKDDSYVPGSDKYY
jgi:antitoxin component YwqK of YwqJK toxin-antitoxin module